MCYFSLPTVVASVDELIQELLDVIKSSESFYLCICLKIEKIDCETIHKKRSSLPKETWNLIADVAEAWYEKSIEREWTEVVSALKCMEKSREAHKLARRKGV